MYTELKQSLPVHVIDKGDGYAIAVIDYGQEHDLIWVVVLNESGEIWSVRNQEVRVKSNWTMGRRF